MTEDGRRSIDRIKAGHRLADVARRSGYEVPNAGRVMVSCPTPGHHDSTPSLLLDLDRDRYWCFGCPSHGDVINWVRDIEGVDTSTALAVLDSRRAINAVAASTASRISRAVTSRERPQLDRTPTSRVLAANRLAWEYYSFPALHERAIGYLGERGIDVGALEAERSATMAGHTPSSRTRIDGLTVHLQTKGFCGAELVDAGLATRLDDGCLVDFHRDRVILPVKSQAGTVIGLLGRDVTGTASIKYLNPPSTASYHKNAALYRPNIHSLDTNASTVVCEGPLDALAVAAHAAAAGLSRLYAPVAACGCHLSDAQVGLILDVHPKPPVLAADGDPAGHHANLDWAARILVQGRESVITEFPPGYDPAAWLAARGAEGLRAVTRTGCLDDHTGALRPRHCAKAITEAAFPHHDQYFRLDPAVVADTVRAATAHLGPASGHRYLIAAASVFGLNPDVLVGAADRARASPAGAPAQPSTPRFERTLL